MALSPTAITIDQDNLGRYARHQQSVSGSRTDKSGADDRDPRHIARVR
jgi:hypothetical protein